MLVAVPLSAGFSARNPQSISLSSVSLNISYSWWDRATGPGSFQTLVKVISNLHNKDMAVGCVWRNLEDPDPPQIPQHLLLGAVQSLVSDSPVPSLFCSCISEIPEWSSAWHYG